MNDGWWIGAATIFGGVVTTIGNVIINQRKNAQQLRSLERDQITQKYETIVTRLETDIHAKQADFHNEIRTLEGKLNLCEEAHRKCEQDAGDLRGEVRILQLTVSQMRGGIPIGFGQPITNASIICDQDGRIVQVNAAASAMFHYLESEFLGLNVTAIIPKRLRAAHSVAIKALRQANRPPDSNRVLQLHGLTREGEEFPIEVSMNGWPGPKGWYYHAELRRRKESPEPSGEFQVVKIEAPTGSIVDAKIVTNGKTPEGGKPPQSAPNPETEPNP